MFVAFTKSFITSENRALRHEHSWCGSLLREVILANPGGGGLSFRKRLRRSVSSGFRTSVPVFSRELSRADSSVSISRFEQNTFRHRLSYSFTVARRSPVITSKQKRAVFTGDFFSKTLLFYGFARNTSARHPHTRTHARTRAYLLTKTHGFAR